MRGRKPVPAERKARLGNPGKRPIPQAVAIIEVNDFLEPPKHLQTSGKRVWCQVNRFASTWVNQDLDTEVLTVACEIADDRERLKRILKKDGHFQRIPIMTARGDIVGEEIKIHPARKELRAQDAAYLRLLSVLGLTPTDRSRLKLTEAQAENEFDKWLKAQL